MKLTDEELMSYADGEMTPFEAKRIEKAMAEDPALAARVARFRSVRSNLRKAYDSVISEPVPEHLRALLGDVAASEPSPPPRSEARKVGLRLGPPAWIAVGASLVIGVIVGFFIAPRPLLTTDGLFSGAALTRVLNERLSAAPENQTAQTRVGVTFRSKDGDVCRTFSHQARGQIVSGIACRFDERWAIRSAMSDPIANAPYRDAGGLAPGVRDAVDEFIDGEPLSAEQERALRDGGWR